MGGTVVQVLLSGGVCRTVERIAHNDRGCREWRSNRQKPATGEMMFSHY
jgi:hypothetical protein